MESTTMSKYKQFHNYFYPQSRGGHSELDNLCSELYNGQELSSLKTVADIHNQTKKKTKTLYKYGTSGFQLRCASIGRVVKIIWREGIDTSSSVHLRAWATTNKLLGVVACL